MSKIQSWILTIGILLFCLSAGISFLRLPEELRHGVLEEIMRNRVEIDARIDNVQEEVAGKCSLNQVRYLINRTSHNNGGYIYR